MFSAIEPGYYKIQASSLKEKDFGMISRNFDYFAHDYEKGHLKCDAAYLRYYLNMKSPPGLISPVVLKTLDRFGWIRDEPISIVKYLILLTYMESTTMFRQFHVVDVIPSVILAYMINLNQNVLFNRLYGDALVGWGHKSIFEVMEVILKSPVYEEIAKMHSNFAFHLVDELVNIEMLNILNIPKFFRQFDMGHGFLSLDGKSPIFRLSWKISDCKEFDVTKILKLIKLDRLNIVPILGYKIDNQDDAIALYYPDFGLVDERRRKDSNFLLSVAQGILYLHQSGFIHGNLSLNCIFQSTDRIMIGHVGESELIGHSRDYQDDVWAFGQIILTIYLGPNWELHEKSNWIEKAQSIVPAKIFYILERCSKKDRMNFDTILRILMSIEK